MTVLQALGTGLTFLACFAVMFEVMRQIRPKSWTDRGLLILLMITTLWQAFKFLFAAYLYW